MEKGKQKRDEKRNAQIGHKHEKKALHTGNKKLDGPNRPST